MIAYPTFFRFYYIDNKLQYNIFCPGLQTLPADVSWLMIYRLVFYHIFLRSQKEAKIHTLLSTIYITIYWVWLAPSVNGCHGITVRSLLWKTLLGSLGSLTRLLKFTNCLLGCLNSLVSAPYHLKSFVRCRIFFHWLVWVHVRGFSLESSRTGMYLCENARDYLAGKWNKTLHEDVWFPGIFLPSQ